MQRGILVIYQDDDEIQNHDLMLPILPIPAFEVVQMTNQTRLRYNAGP